MDVPLTHPKVVHDLHGLLELYRNVHCNVVVETWTNGELLWQWRPVVLTPCVDKGNSVLMISNVKNKSFVKLDFIL